MKYAMTRKLNLKRFFPDMQYEMVDFHVEDCNTKKEAMEEIDTWIKEYLQQKKEDIKKAVEDSPFDDDTYAKK